MAASAPVETIADPSAMLAKAIEMEQGSACDYNAAAQTCGANADAVSKQLFEHLVADEEAHQSEFERQLDNIRRFGLSYLALQSFGVSSPRTGVGLADSAGGRLQDFRDQLAGGHGIGLSVGGGLLLVVELLLGGLLHGGGLRGHPAVLVGRVYRGIGGSLHGAGLFEGLLRVGRIG